MHVLNIFSFDRRGVPPTDVETALDLAVIAAEAIHGEDRVAIETEADFDADDHVVTIDATAIVGRHVSRLFAGYLRRLYGAAAFRVERIEIPEDDDALCCGAPEATR